MTKTITVEGDAATVDAIARLTTQGSVTAPSLVTPAGSIGIDKLIVTASAEGLADGSASFFIRLGGSAVLDGEQTIVVSAGGRIAVQAGSDSAPCILEAQVFEDMDIATRATDTLTVSGEMAGSDLGTAHFVVTLVFK